MPLYWIRESERKMELRYPEPGAPCVEVKGHTCSKCGKPLLLFGEQRRIAGYDFYECDALCFACRAPSGKLRLVCSTVFGLEEDEAVLNSHGVRVY